MGKIFGTDGVRGKANVKLTPELAFNLGRAAATVLIRNKRGAKSKIIIGKDTRISGDMLEAALAAGICATGAQAVLLGVIPTPGVAMLCRHLGSDAGVVISASHNHFADNGIKFFSGDGYKLSDAVEEEIEYFLQNSEEIPRALAGDIGSIKTLSGAARLYTQLLKEAQPVDLTGLKLVVDPANGAAFAVAAPLLRELGAGVTEICHEPDGCNINDGCGSTHPQLLQQEVLAKQADLGIALDGDADRLVVVDERGELVDGDEILAVCAAALKRRGRLKNDLLVMTVMSNMGLSLAMEKIDVKTVTTKVGDRYVLEKMQELGAVLGGEQSGHIIFSEYNTTGDGLASALFLLSVLVESKKPLSELTKVIKRLPQVLVNVPVNKKEDWEADADIREVYERACAVLEGQGRILLRPSGTEQLIRVMLEGPDLEKLQQLSADLAQVLTEKRGL
ncbi:MAG: phosphoglucosamine mutase [Bacillota bacterium]|jgi:phosphoglucosamine mutase